MKRERNITRVDYVRTHSWWVRIYRGTGADKTVTSMHFPDKRWGGKRKALAAAVSWRDRQVKKLEPAQNGGGVWVPVGHGYVRKAWVPSRQGESTCWTAWIKTPERWVGTTRSIAKWGEAEARRRCEQWVRERRAELGLRKRKAA